MFNNDTVSASSSFVFKLGVEIPNKAPSPFTAQLTVGFKDSSLFGLEGFANAAFPIDDAYARFTRYPVELLGLYRLNEQFRLGLGVTYHASPTLECEEAQSGTCAGVPDVKFDDALGGVIQLERAGDTFMWGIRYTFIDYETGGSRFDGNSLGIFLGVRLWR